MIHATEKSMKELGEQLSDEEKGQVESAISALKEAMKGDDKAEIDAKTQALAEASGKIAERVYAQKQSAEGGAGAESAAGAETGEAGQGAQQEDVVDAEFEEVKEEGKK
jgi:molecular chaperone DnaK